MKSKTLIAVLAVTFFLSWQAEKWNEVSIKTEDGTIYGTLLDCGKEAPVALMIAGSGPTDRDGNQSGGNVDNSSLEWLALDLYDRGISTLRYDKRTSGKSAGSFENKKLVLEDFVDDAVSSIRYLKSQGYGNIYLIGHSQGSLVGTLAAQREDVSGLISLSGPGRSIDLVLADQFKNLSNSFSEETSEILSRIKTGKPVGKMSPEAKKFFSTDNVTFLKAWIAYNPVDEIAKLEIPMIFIAGETDIQVPLEELELISAEVGPENCFVIPSMNHVLKEAPADRQKNLKSYSDPSYEIADGLAETIESFIR